MTPQPWNLPDSDFRGFDAVVLRSNWDYHLDPDGFRAWLARVEREGARVFNPPDLVRWNVSKRYLQAIEGGFHFLTRQLADRLDALAALADGDLALAFARHIERLVDLGRSVLALLPRIGLDDEIVGQFVMEAQHRLLTEVTALVDKKEIVSTVSENFGTINAANLKKAHALIESGRAKGKVVLAGF